MGDELNAWGNYDELARSARTIARRRNTITRVTKRNSVAVTDTSRLSITASTHKGWVELFGDVEELQQRPFSSEVEKKDEMLADEELTSMSSEIREYIRKIFAVYFEGSFMNQRKKTAESKEKSHLFPSIPIISSINATMPWVQPYLERHPAPFKQLVLFIELSLRGIGQVYFQNNPLSGLLILIGLFVQSTRVAIHGTLALVVGNLTSILLGFDSGLTRSGLFGYNAVLVGLALATFDAAEKHSNYELSTILFTVLMAMLSSIVFLPLGKILHPYKSPPLTLPFNLVTMMLLVAVADMYRVEIGPVRDPSFPDYFLATYPDVTMKQFFGGAIRGIGQVFLANELASGLLVLAAIAMSSRVAAVAALLGSACGAGVALATGVDPAIVEAGLYGYNPSLTVTALFFFYAPSLATALLSLVAGMTTVIAQQALSAMLQPYGLPVMTLPFCVATLPFIMMQGTTKAVIAIPLDQLTVPEDHLRRLKALEDGTKFLREILHPDDDHHFRYGRKIEKSLHRLGSAVEAGSSALSLESSDLKPSSGEKRESTIYEKIRGVGVDSDEWVQEAALAIFEAISSKNGAVRLSGFRRALTMAGLAQSSGLEFASLVFNLMDLDRSNSIEQNEFVALCMASLAITSIRDKISEFFFFVDLNGNGRIDFDEIDASLEYLLLPKLTPQERQILASMTSTSMLSSSNDDDDDDGEMDVVELINLLTVSKIKSIVALFHTAKQVANSRHGS